jgi:hypothetical protein
LQRVDLKENTEESQPHLDRTDELPVLSDEALREDHAASRRRPPLGADPLSAALRDGLNRIEARWQSLEQLLLAQSAAIAELAHAVGHTGIADETATLPAATASNLRFLPATSVPEHPPFAETGAVAPADAEPWSEPLAKPARTEEPADPGVLKLRQQIASLESYIDARAGHWQVMEAELARQAQRIEELESLLAPNSATGPGSDGASRNGGD